MYVSEKLKNYLKLFAAGIMFVWLFIQSPLNPLYSEYNQAELDFVKLNFIYWVFVSVFLLWIIFFINRLNFERHLTKIFVLSNFLYLSFFIFYGFDVLDTGFSLSKQWAMFHGMWSENFDAIAGTNLIGGLWLLIPGQPSLIWSRLGFIVVQVSIVAVSYKIMLLHFKAKQIFIVILPLSLFFAVWNFYQTINYDNLPFLFFITSIYFLLKGFKREIFKKHYFIISGMIAILAAFCKITYLAALLLPLFLIIVDYNLLPKDKKNIKDKILYFLFGLLIGLGLLAGLIFILGGLESYLFYFGDIIKELVSVKDPTKIHSANHSLIGLYTSYKDSIMYMISKVINYSFFILLIEYFRNKTKNFKSMNYTTILIGSFVLYYLIFEVTFFGQYTNNMFRYLLSFFVSVYVLWAIFTDNSVIKKYLILIITSVGLFLFAFAGSDLVFRAAYHPSSELILFALPIILIKDTEFKFLNVKIKFTFLFYFVIVFFALHIVNKKDNIYREANFKFLANAFKSQSLVGIKSSPQRVEVVDSLLTYLDQIPEIDKKKIMFTHSNALMYYLTGTNYILNTPWDILNDYYELEQDLNFLKPDLFVVPKLSHRIGTWPLKSKPDGLESKAKKHYDVYDKFIKENNYVEIYKNSFYTVYSSEIKELTNEK